MKLPFELLLPRIEALEAQARAASQVPHAGPTASAPADHHLRHSVDSLTRAWLRLSNDVSVLAARVPEAGTRNIGGRLAALESKLEAAEPWAAIERLSGTVDSLTRTWLKLQAEVTVQAAAVSALRNEMDGRAGRLADMERALHEDVAQRGRRVDDTLRFLLDRVEFVRRELLFELRYGAGTSAERPAVQARILAPEKIEAARAAGALRLNLGCGHIALPEFVNVDMRDLPGVDVVAESGALPFDPGSVDEIFSAHLVEHFPQEEMLRRILPHWRGVLKPGGTLRAITPDGAAMLAGLADGSYSFDDFRDVLFGGQDYEGDFHYNLFTPETLARMVEQTGFVAPETPVRGRRNGQCFEFELVARVPAPVAATQRSG